MKANKNGNFMIRLWGLLGSVNVRIKIFGIVLGSTLILSLSFVYQVRYSFHNVLEHKSQEQGVSIARDVAARATDLILVNDLFSLHELLAETKENYADVRYAFIMDSQGRMLAHTFGEGFPLGLIDVNAVNPGEYQNTVAVDAGEEEVWDVAVPIFEGKAGVARVGISERSVHQTLALLTTQMLAILAAVLIGSLLAATSLTWVLTRPIMTLVDATKKVAMGDFSPRVARWANDEIGDLAVSFNQMATKLGRLDEIRQEREQLRRQLLEGVITAQEDERRRIARELHDSTSQSLTSLIIGLKNLEECCDNPDILPHFVQLREETGRTLDEVHALALRLRPAVLDDLGLEAALERLVSEWRLRYNVSADVLVHLREERLPGDVETTLYRIVQEALTNIGKHAQANSVSVLVERKDRDVIAIIEDDGIGFDMSSSFDRGHLGLLGMRERAELLLGNLILESRDREGTSIFVTIPITCETEFSDA
jgi:signal transduction histidine kinase